MSTTARTRRPTPGWARAGLVIGCFVAVLWVVELVDALAHQRLDALGVRPRTEEGLWGVLFAPMLHSGWTHLEGNTVPLLVLGFLVLLAGVARWVVVTAWAWVVGGLGAWLTGASGTVHLGASVLVFGWLAYLVVAGFLARRFWPVVAAVAVLLVYGVALVGVLPGQPGISWQGHLFGAIGGVLAAWFTRPRRGRSAVPFPP